MVTLNPNRTACKLGKNINEKFYSSSASLTEFSVKSKILFVKQKYELQVLKSSHLHYRKIEFYLNQFFFHNTVLSKIYKTFCNVEHVI